MMLTHLMPLQGHNNFGNLLFRPLPSKLSDFLRLGFPFQECVQHQLPGDSGNVREYITQFYVRILQHFLHPILFR